MLPVREPAPWYRQPWPWLLMIPPLAAVIGGLAMLILTARQPLPMVVDDYGKIGLVTQRNQARDRAAQQAGVAARLVYQADQRLLSVELENARPVWLDLRLLHPTLAEHDLELRLLPRDGRYQARLPVGVAGRYHLQLLPPDAGWRLTADWRGQPELRVMP